ncbi:MAG: bifunctional tetrahydrofolate synthase/dihydrofolate synthase, partial [Casimicrobiaceae bacterium]
PKSIAMGLERVRDVHAHLVTPLHCPVITVAGTNGKGSTCALLDAILRCAGYRAGLYTSPHLLRYNERVRIAGREATDAELIDAFNAVEDARRAACGADGAPVTLTYFEFGTLAALWLFARAGLDAVILEVGLGGRLDAVNIVDPDVAIVTSVDIDHIDYLGATREAIGREKAGIFRAGRPALCADPDPPESVTAAASAISAQLLRIGRDYGYVNESSQWRYRGPRNERYGLPFPALRGAYQLANAATALAALDLLHSRLPVTAGALREGLLTVELAGRFQVLPGRPAIVLDVAHNPHAARALAEALGAMGYYPETIAVCGMLADKDIAGVVTAMRDRVDRWHVATIPGPRGARAEAVRDALAGAGVRADAVRMFADIPGAYAAARDLAGETDRIVVFGCFSAVAQGLVVTAR